MDCYQEAERFFISFQLNTNSTKKVFSGAMIVNFSILFSMESGQG